MIQVAVHRDHRISSPGQLCRFLAAAVVLLLVTAAVSPAQPGFIVDVTADAMALPRVADEPTVVKQRFVDLRLDVIDSLAIAEAKQLRFDLFSDLRPVGIFDRREDRDDDSYTWYGRIENSPESYVVLVKHRDVVFAQLDLPDQGLFQVRYTAAGHHEVVQLDPSQFLPCATGPEHAIAAPHPAVQDAPQEGGGATPRADDGSKIDVLVLYTTTARIAAGGTNSIESVIIMSVNLTNNAYVNSLVNPRLRLVHMAETDYPESGSAGTDLGRFASPGDGFVDEVHAMRNEYGADLCALIVNSFDACGIAYLMTSLSPGFQSLAFSVTARGCAAANLTFAHEVGHIQGCHHDRDNAGSAIYPYSYGHRFTAASQLRRTIMAYDPGARVTHFSNPDVLFSGVPTGVPIGEPLQAHNAQTINNTALTVSQFRAALPEDFDPPEPNPMTFSVPPAPINSTSISMSATAATDESLPIRYYFQETTGNPGANHSGWQTVSSYVDSGLTPNTEYGYRVQARDNESVPNQTAFSETAYAATHIQTPGQLGAITLSATSVQILAPGVFTNLNLGLSGILFEADPPGDYTNVNVWNSATSVVVSGLMPGRLYSFRAKARNQYGVETGWSPLTYVETFPLIGDCNDDGVFDLDGDLPCFVDALLGIESFPGAIERSDINFDGFTDALDIPDMIFCLVYAACN